MRITGKLAGCLILFFCVSLSKGQQKQAYLNVSRVSGSAIDANGVRHKTWDYPGYHGAWLDDRLAAVAPHYPLEDLRQHHQGVCWVKLTLDLKTGRVNNVVLTKSSGFNSLDQSAMMAFRKWRWKPGKWKEIEISADFTMRGSRLAPGAVQLSHE
jgi:TonB family protein